MNKLDGKAIAYACGTRDCDTLRIVNQWAAVTIGYGEERRAWFVTGDLADTRLTEKWFTSPTDAMSYAWRSLAEYQYGRAD
jgi:hypothetical protein